MKVQNIRKDNSLIVDTAKAPAGWAHEKSALRKAIEGLSAGQRVTVPNGFEGKHDFEMKRYVTDTLSAVRSSRECKKSGKKFALRGHDDRVEVYRIE